MTVPVVSNNGVESPCNQGANETRIPKNEKENTITNIAYLCLKSPFLWTFGGLAASWCVFPLTTSLVITATVIGGMAAFPHQIPTSLHYEAAIIDSIGRDFLTRAGLLNQPYYNKISSGIYLGALPLKGFYDESTLISKLNIKAVLVVVEDYELNTETLFSSPVQKSDWMYKGVEVCHIPVKDMTNLSIEDLHKAADFIQTNKDGIYIHCKAGRGRSVMCLIAYLVKYEKFSYEDAEKFARYKRPAISLKNWQKEILRKFTLEIENKS